MNCHVAVLWAALCLVSAPVLAYSPPAGIPMPGFGILESHTQYAGLPGYQDAGNGPYTHYVDSTAANCVSSGAGTHLVPLCDIPDSVPAGAVVEVHGGPYTDHDPEITAAGTESQPVFIRGVDDGSGLPVFQNGDQLTLYGSYFVLEYFDLEKTRLNLGFNEDSVSNVAARNLRVHDHDNKNGVNIFGTNVVLLENEIDHNQGDDRHGTFIASESVGIWILDNYYHHNGGDAIQFCHGCEVNPPNTVYIGRNTMHSDRENGVDLKYAENIVISENVFHSYVESPADVEWCFDDASHCGTYSSGSDGSAIVIGSDGAPTNIWILFNTIHDSEIGVRIEEAGSTVNIVGNLLYRLSDSGVAMQKRGEPVKLYLNTFYDMPKGIHQYWRERFDVEVVDNIFAQMDMAIYYKSKDIANRSTLDSNIFWHDSGVLSLKWKQNKSITTSTEINELSGNCKLDNILADPGLVNPVADQFGPSATSIAIDNATDALVILDQAYRSTIAGGTSIMQDLQGNPRIQGAMAIGALEFVVIP